jgi:hypothetical protein
VADSVDHVPPRAARPQIIALGLASRYPFQEVPACRECNSALGYAGPWHLAQRKVWIKRWLRRRYAKYLRIPMWTDSELGRLGPQFQQFVIAGLARKAEVEHRLRW